MTDTHMTTEDAAGELGKTTRRILQYIKDGDLDAIRIGPTSRGGRWLVSRVSVAELKAQHTHKPPKAGYPKGRKRSP